MLDELRLRNHADNTVERYLDVVKSFASYFPRSPDQLGPEQIREYLLHLVKDWQAAPNRLLGETYPGTTLLDCEQIDKVSATAKFGLHYKNFEPVLPSAWIFY
jgi:hypothetical protein